MTIAAPSVYLLERNSLSWIPFWKAQEIFIFFWKLLIIKLLLPCRNESLFLRVQGVEPLLHSSLSHSSRAWLQPGKGTAFIMNCVPSRGISQLHWGNLKSTDRLQRICRKWEQSSHTGKRNVSLQNPSRETYGSMVSGLWVKASGWLRYLFLTGSFVKVSCFLILPSRHPQSFKIMQKAQNVLGSQDEMSKWWCLRQKASITYWEFVNFLNLKYFLTLLHSMKREQGSYRSQRFCVSTWDHVFLPKEVWSYTTHGSFSSLDAFHTTHT